MTKELRKEFVDEEKSLSFLVGNDLTPVIIPEGEDDAGCYFLGFIRYRLMTPVFATVVDAANWVFHHQLSLSFQLSHISSLLNDFIDEQISQKTE